MPQLEKPNVTAEPTDSTTNMATELALLFSNITALDQKIKKQPSTTAAEHLKLITLKIEYVQKKHALQIKNGKMEEPLKNKAVDLTDTKAIDAALEEELEAGFWLHDINRDYKIMLKSNKISPDCQLYWESTFDVLKTLYNPQSRDKFLATIEQSWRQGYFAMQEVPTRHGNVPFHIEHYVTRSDDFHDPSQKYLIVIKNTIHGLHRDVLNAYKWVKNTGRDDLLQEFFKAPYNAYCIEARVRAIQNFQEKNEKDLPFADIVENILKNYAVKLAEKHGDKVLSLDELVKQNLMYIEDIIDFAKIYHPGYKARDGETMKDLPAYLEMLAYDNRPADKPAVWTNATMQTPEPSIHEPTTLTDEQIDKETQQLDYQLNAITTLQDLEKITYIFQKGLEQQITELENRHPKQDSKAWQQLNVLYDTKLQLTAFATNMQKNKSIALTKPARYCEMLHDIISDTASSLDKVGYPNKFKQFLTSIKEAFTKASNLIFGEDIKVPHRTTSKQFKKSLQFSEHQQKLTSLTKELQHLVKPNDRKLT